MVDISEVVPTTPPGCAAEQSIRHVRILPAFQAAPLAQPDGATNEKYKTLYYAPTLQPKIEKTCQTTISK